MLELTGATGAGSARVAAGGVAGASAAGVFGAACAAGRGAGAAVRVTERSAGAARRVGAERSATSAGGAMLVTGTLVMVGGATGAAIGTGVPGSDAAGAGPAAAGTEG